LVRSPEMRPWSLQSHGHDVMLAAQMRRRLQPMSLPGKSRSPNIA